MENTYVGFPEAVVTFYSPAQHSDRYHKLTSADNHDTGPQGNLQYKYRSMRYQDMNF